MATIALAPNPVSWAVFDDIFQTHNSFTLQKMEQINQRITAVETEIKEVKSKIEHVEAEILEV